MIFSEVTLQDPMQGDRCEKHAVSRVLYSAHTHVYEFGGIIDWTGDIMKNKTEPIRNTCVLVIEAGEKRLSQSKRILRIQVFSRGAICLQTDPPSELINSSHSCLMTAEKSS